MTTNTPVIDLTDLDLFEHGDPHLAWHHLRENAPVYWNDAEPHGFWAVTRHEDVSQVYLDRANYSSAGGTVLGGSYRRERDSASGKMLIASDAPEHTRLRKSARCAFNQDILRRAADRIETNLDRAMATMRGNGGGDFAHEIARELPAGFVMAMFGVGRADADHILELTERMIGHKDPTFVSGDEAVLLAATQMEIFEVMSELLEDKRDNPGTDLVSLLLADSTMNEEEILYNCLNVAVGGNETTPYTASAAVRALDAHPEQAEQLSGNPDLVASAVQEIFRWTSTNAYVQRVVTRDVHIQHQLVRAGDSVTLWNSSANRDPRAFADPEVFDLARDPNPHIAFGVGPHRCIGANVATMEISLFVRYLAEHQVRFEITGQPRNLRSNFMLGTTQLPVRIVNWSQ